MLYGWEADEDGAIFDSAGQAQVPEIREDWPWLIAGHVEARWGDMILEAFGCQGEGPEERAFPLNRRKLDCRLVNLIPMRPIDYVTDPPRVGRRKPSKVYHRRTVADREGWKEIPLNWPESRRYEVTKEGVVRQFGMHKGAMRYRDALSVRRDGRVTLSHPEEGHKPFPLALLIAWAWKSAPAPEAVLIQRVDEPPTTRTLRWCHRTAVPLSGWKVIARQTDSNWRHYGGVPAWLR